MPEAGFDQDLNLPTGEGTFVRLKKQGDKIKFILAKTPHYETIHWIGERETVLCGRFNSNDKKAKCAYCDDYQKALDRQDKAAAKQIRPVTNFYYPVLNLLTGKRAIFQFSAKSIHYTIKSYADAGLDVFATVWSVERTNEEGRYYVVLNLGDKELKKLTPELQEELERAKKLELKARESQSVTVSDQSDSGEDIPQ